MRDGSTPARGHHTAKSARYRLQYRPIQPKTALKGAAANPPAGETAASIETARQRLAQGDKADAERVFAEIAEREEQRGDEANRNAAEAYRNLAALAFLDDSEKAARLYAKAIERDPEDWSSLYRLALLQMRMGNAAAAKSAAERLLALRNRLGGQRLAYYSLFILGDIATSEGHRAAAERHYQEAVEILRSLSESDPSNAEWQRDLSVSYDRVGDIRAARGDRDGALTSYEDGLSIRKGLAARDPSNAEWQRDLFVSYDKIGDIRAARGDGDGALTSYEDGLSIAKGLAARDPSNAQWQTDLVVSHYKIGAAGGQDACGQFRSALAILKRLDAENRLTADQKGWIAAIEAGVAEHCR